MCKNIVKRIWGMACVALLFNGCMDDPYDHQFEEGVPVEAMINFSVPQMTNVSTRSLTDADEARVNDLYLFVFSSGGTFKSRQYYDTDALHNKTVLPLKTLSGSSEIYAITNVTGNELSGEETPLKEKLDDISDLAALKALTATLTNRENINRSQPSLVMSGHLTCNIPDVSGGKIDGTLFLKRLDSSITFKVTPKMKSDGGVITSFKLNSWRVCNIPTKSYLIAREKSETDRDAGKTKEDYTHSAPSIFMDTDGYVSSFSFYLLENRKNALTGIERGEYAKREKEIKNPTDDTNTGVYQYVEPYATFVELKVQMEIEKDGIFRIANVTYVVHLGYVENDATDFKNERNKKYTYNIEIQDVDKIIAEVTAHDNSKEEQPGAEGDVVDASTRIFNIDAHYGYVILEFTYEEAKDLQFIINTPFGPQTTNKMEANKENHDYNWIHFMRCKDGQTLANYSPNNLNIFQLGKDVEDQFKRDQDRTKKYYYTAFIDEYYYEKSPCNNLIWNENEKLNWARFVNQDNRYVLLKLSPQYSADKESSYAQAKYMITQKSIQTYYSTTTFNDSKAALGMEHENETGIKPCFKLYEYELKTYDGFYNTYNFIDKDDISWDMRNYKKWTRYTNPTIYVDGKNTFEVKERRMTPHGDLELGTIEQCFSRNRDENGNGTIDTDEIKWYQPAIGELIGLYLGAQSLPSPLFTAQDRSAFRSEYNSNFSHDYILRNKFHYATSNEQRFWADEGASFGNLEITSGARPGGGGEKVRIPEKFRCVRMLGVKVTDADVSSQTRSFVGKTYDYDANTRIANVKYMNARSVRTGKVENAELGTHNNFSNINAPYKAFQIATGTTPVNGQGRLWSYFFYENGKSACADYAETGAGKGTWRAPNQRELMIMYMIDPKLVKAISGPGTKGAYCRTSWEFDTFHFGMSNDNIYMDRNDNDGGTYLRCVRDVEPS